MADAKALEEAKAQAKARAHAKGLGDAQADAAAEAAQAPLLVSNGTWLEGVGAGLGDLAAPLWNAGFLRLPGFLAEEAERALADATASLLAAPRSWRVRGRWRPSRARCSRRRPGRAVCRWGDRTGLGPCGGRSSIRWRP